MEYVHPEALVTTEWLSNNLGASDIAIVDASFHMAAAGRNAQAEYTDNHIPGAVFFDVDEIADTDSDLPHMLPSPEKFSSRVRKLGIGSETHVICYDTNGGPAAAMRAWWTFRAFGHDRVSVLSGGLPKWQDEGRPITADETPIVEKHFFPKFDHSLVLSFDQMMANVDSNEYQMVDARSEGRYNGTEEEPRAGMRKGHIPGAISLPFQNLMDTGNFMVMRSAEELTAVINETGIDPEKPLVSNCGSGVTAAPLVMALYLLGHTRAAIYDGSWTEWGGRDDTPIDV
tara:strand:- start:1643 stop:2500 length:858 start_codon:yes stop_codon:yes gene_type:complete